MRLKNKDALVTEIVSVLDGRAEVIAAYLFGSCLTRTADARDVDIAVILDTDFRAGPLYDVLLAEEIEKNLDGRLPVDLKVMNNSPVYFQYKVLREGRLIYNRDNIARGRYEVKVSNRYFDFKPFLDYYNKCLHRNIKEGFYGPGLNIDK